MNLSQETAPDFPSSPSGESGAAASPRVLPVSALAGFFLFCLAAAMLPLLWLGPGIVDDAYITFRYAENLAAGKGFVFNESDGPVQGASTPLFTILLAGARLAGIPCRFSALALAVAGAALAYYCGALLFLPRRRPVGKTALLTGAGWVLVLGTLPEWISVLGSGMESTLFVGLAIAAIAAATRGRPALAGALCALTVLARYDGWALAFIVLLWCFWVHRRRSGLGAGLFLLLQVPWVVYAALAFGAYAPQSIEAKRLIHSCTLASNCQAHLNYFWGALEGMPGCFPHRNLLPFFFLGTGFALWRRTPAPLLMLLWGLASVAGYCYARILLQSWYMMPALVAYTWVALWGARETVQGLEGRLHGDGAEARPETGPQDPATRGKRCLALGLLVTAILLLFAANLRFIWPGREKWVEYRTLRERSYFEAAQWVRERSRPGSRVLVGEVGVLGWALLDYEVLDSAGINSRRILQIRRENTLDLKARGIEERRPGEGRRGAGEGSPEWVLRVVAEMRPDFVVSTANILWVGLLRADPRFLANYQEVQVISHYPALPVYIFQRRTAPA